MMTKALDRTKAETEFENEQDKIFIEMPIPRTLSEIGFLQESFSIGVSDQTKNRDWKCVLKMRKRLKKI